MTPKQDSTSVPDAIVVATDRNYNEARYLAVNPDVAEAVKCGLFPTGHAHFITHGKAEGRTLHVAAPDVPAEEGGLAQG